MRLPRHRRPTIDFAVARAGRWLGLGALVVVPEATTHARVQAIEAEGARVERVDGDYDAAVLRAASLADDGHLVIADTSWPGYEEIPRRVVVPGDMLRLSAAEGELSSRDHPLGAVPVRT